METRTKLLLKDSGCDRLKKSSVLIVGTGGVGGYTAEFLCRAGIGELTLVDGDTIEASNLNRQIISLSTNIGRPKADAISERLKTINPELTVHTVNSYIHEDDVHGLITGRHYDFIVDAIDSVGPKCKLIEEAFSAGIPIISSLGAGARTHAESVHITKLSNTHNDGLGRAVRKKLRELNISNKLMVAFSEEDAHKDAILPSPGPGKKNIVGTVSWIPAAFGCHIAQHVVLKLIESK